MPVELLQAGERSRIRSDSRRAALSWCLSLIDKHRRAYPSLYVVSDVAKALDALREDVARERMRKVVAEEDEDEPEL